MERIGYGGSTRHVRIVSATRTSEQLFWRASYLGRSLARIPEQLRPDYDIAFENAGPVLNGLSAVYNRAIESAPPGTVAIFVHDDVYIHDWFIAARALEAIESYDIVGLAGSVNPDLAQPSWGLGFDGRLRATGWQPGLQRSGAVNHFDIAHPDPSVYGPTPLECQLLDGLLLIAAMDTVRSARIRFDERLAFHLYDLDFCRQARSAGLRLGTWPISVTHNSGGAFGSKEFRRAARLYLDKWGSE